LSLFQESENRERQLVDEAEQQSRSEQSGTKNRDRKVVGFLYVALGYLKVFGTLKFRVRSHFKI